MSENKKKETQVSPPSTNTTSVNPAENREKKPQKACPALYPSKPHTSNK